MVKNIDNLKKNKNILEYLGKCKAKIRRAILANADKELVDSICQCVFNMLSGNIDLNENEKRNLVKYKKTLRTIVGRSTLKEKKKILVQQGGFLQFLIPIFNFITGISQILSSWIGSSNKDSST